MYATHARTIVVLLLAAASAARLSAQEQPAVKIQTIQVSENVYMLMGAGGNIGLSVGDDGALLIDSAYAPLTDRLAAAVASVCKKPVRIVINTHWHFDHIGGNESLAGAGALVVAHENVRKRMTTEQFLHGISRAVPPSPARALPVIAYVDALTLHWNGDQVRVLHMKPAHTDGDSFIQFRKANVLHLGDVYFNGTYPYIDINAGGSIAGMIAAVDEALALANEQTKIIPGHGPLSNLAELRAYREMLATVGDRVQAMVRQGKPRDEVIASKPTKEYDAKWSKGGFDPDGWVGLVYDGMTRKEKP